ncbi:hypothetical protein [Bradyrhizobium uaiense]|uniref:Uncharacterized protein n=1 Tax=Bradyrhizobium uaiense TaxID=2594946 RepID=A0A6P1BB32_9BRAD|nr:hypothetical protein [Bradyrhizobium uaiense]NEU95615.1 hypothetical protein [Bradyrhizobium uaiense]
MDISSGENIGDGMVIATRPRYCPEILSNSCATSEILRYQSVASQEGGAFGQLVESKTDKMSCVSLWSTAHQTEDEDRWSNAAFDMDRNRMRAIDQQ